MNTAREKLNTWGHALSTIYVIYYHVSGKEMDESSATDDDEEEDITEHPELADLFQPAKKDEEADK